MFETQKHLNTTDGSKGQPIDICFRNISYTVQILDQTVTQSPVPCFKTMTDKILLKNLSGIFKAGQLTAIMGASGAGKTTLLNTLACRVNDKNVMGSKSVNRVPYNFDNFGEFANYVMQQDVLMETLTVRETLEFAANLKLNTSDEQKQSRIKKLVKKFKLQRCLDTMVGGQLLKGVSGGQKKRTSIAFELISDPAVLVLDEPTSGLDSLTSFIICRYLKQLAVNQGKTIFMTIHQPNSEIYELFDRLMLMVEGRFIYQGSAREAVDYFSSNFGLTCGQFVNPADYFMSIMHHESKANLQRYPKYFKCYEQHLAPAIEKDMQNESSDPARKRQVGVSFCTSLKVLIGKDILNTIRNPMILKMRLLSTIFLSIYTAGLYFQFTGDYENRLNWRALTGFLFFMSISTLMSSLAPTELVFPAERGVFLKQEGAKLYSTFSYFLSRNIVEIPTSIIIPLVQTLIIYWFIGLHSTVEQFFIHYLVAYLLIINGISLGFMIGSMILDQKSVSVVTPIILLPIILFSGFFKNTGNIPVWIGWIQYISPIKYGFAGWLQNEVSHTTKSLVNELNLDTGLWLSIGLLILLGVTFRLTSMFFLWFMRSRLE